MVGAGIVLVLATLVVPIAMIAAAVVFDLLFLGWIAARTIRARLIPAIEAKWPRVSGVPQRHTA